MKIYLTAVFVLFFQVSSAFSGIFDSPLEGAIAAVQSEARAERMPSDFFGVKWLTAKHELIKIRRNVVPQDSEFLAEQIVFISRKAAISYYIKTGNVIMYIITFKGPTSDDGFKSTQIALNRDFGPMSPPVKETDEYGNKYCSNRVSVHFKIVHCIRLYGDTPIENIVFSRRGQK